MKSVNCNLSICSISLATHASMELGKNYAVEHLTWRKSHIITIVTAVHKWASIGLMAYHDHPLNSQAHLSTDSFWQRMARVRYAAIQNNLCAFLSDRKHICGSMTTNACRFGIPKRLWMAVDKTRRALQRKIRFQQIEVHQQWNNCWSKTHLSSNPYTH